MDKSKQSGYRDKKTAGPTDNWKEIKYNDPTPAPPPKKDSFWEAITRPHWTGEQARKRGLSPN